MNPPKKTCTKVLDSAELTLKIVEMRRSGMSLQSIGREVGLDISSVCKRVSRYVQEVREACTENLAAERQLDVERMDRLIAAWGPMAETGDPKAAELMCKFLDMRIKLIGHGAANRTEISGPSGAAIAVEVEDSRDRILARLLRQGCDDASDPPKP